MGNLMDDLLDAAIEARLDEARIEALEAMFADLPYPTYEEME
jgi:hypothetical protein